MNACRHFTLLALYNGWMNEKLYAAVEKLPPGELAENKRAFFGSILGTLNHIVVGDTAWLKRFASHPAHFAALDPVRALPNPVSLDQILFTDFAALRAHRTMLDRVIETWTAEMTEDDLGHVLDYTNLRGVRSRRKFASLVVHFFNHQTHHRGQITTLLSQSGIDVGVTDLLALIPDENAA